MINYSLENIFTAHAVTNNRHTMKLEDMPVGAFIQIGDSKFIRVADNKFMQEKPVCRSTIWNYGYTGAVQTFTAPVDGTYKIELWGASGMKYWNNDATGAYTSGQIDLDKGTVVYIYVGAREVNTCNNGVVFNGGGASKRLNNYCRAYSGGGATDVRYFASTPSSEDLTFDSALGLNSRIMVAGGAGGGDGGAAGGLIGYEGGTNKPAGCTTGSCQGESGTGGTQVAGGKSQNTTDGVFGIGASGNPGTSTDNAGSGGGGYYGGGAGYNEDLSNSGGGGSSYISGHTGCVAITSASDRTPKSGCTTGTSDNSCSIHYSGKKFTNTVMIDGAGYAWTNTKGSLQAMPNPTGSVYLSGSGHSGSGFAKITLLPNSPNDNCFTPTCPAGTAYSPETGACSYKKCGAGTTGEYVNATNGICSCAAGKYADVDGSTTVDIAIGVCDYNKYCTGANVAVQYATSQPTCACRTSYYTDSNGGTTPSNTGACSYQKYCTGSNVTNVFATSAPSSCTCKSGYYGNSDGTTSTTTTSGSCVACATNTAYNSTAKRCIATTMQAFTTAMCNAFATPTGTNYTTVGSLKDTRNNTSYVIRKFSDGKCWMANNLAYGTVSNASIYLANSRKSASGILGSGLYGVAVSPGAGYEGYLYNWQAVMQRSDAYLELAYSGPSPVQGICPTGWHVPTGGSSGELQALSGATGTNAAFFSGGNFCASGSSCVAGIADFDGWLSGQGSTVYVWSSTPYSTTDTNRSYNLYAGSGKVYPADYSNRCLGFSVRCVKN